MRGQISFYRPGINARPVPVYRPAGTLTWQRCTTYPVRQLTAKLYPTEINGTPGYAVWRALFAQGWEVVAADDVRGMAA